MIERREEGALRISRSTSAKDSWRIIRPLACSFATNSNGKGRQPCLLLNILTQRPSRSYFDAVAWIFCHRPRPRHAGYERWRRRGRGSWRGRRRQRSRGRRGRRGWRGSWWWRRRRGRSGRGRWRGSRWRPGRRGWRRRRRNLASHGYSAGGPYNVRPWTGLGPEEAQVPSETQQRAP